jgi:FkbM family methyltransferase
MNLNMLQTLRSHYDTARIRWQGFMESAIGGIPVRVHPADRPFWIDTNFNAWEPETLGIFRRFAVPGAQVCDIGAWVGPTSIFAAKLGARVTSFEPDPVAYERLLFNVRMNAPGAVAAHRIALAATDGLRRMGAMASHLGQSGSSLHAPERGDQSADVLALSWESAIRLLELPRFDFIKIDIEGGESELLPTMIPYLEANRPALLVSTHWSFIPENQRNDLLEAMVRLSTIYPAKNPHDLERVRAGFPSFLFTTGDEGKESEESIV